jgi:hypothetical protein
LCLSGELDQYRGEGRSADLRYLGHIWMRMILKLLPGMSMIEACSSALEEIRPISRIWLAQSLEKQGEREEDCKLNLVYGMLDDDVSFVDGGVFFSVQGFRFARGLSYKVDENTENILDGDFIEAVR